MLTLAQQLLYGAVKLNCFSNERGIGSGTGFFYKVQVTSDEYVAVLVTNKHVVEGADKVVAMLHVADGKNPPGPSGEIISATINIDSAPIGHPDKNVDLCFLNVSELLMKAEAAGKAVFHVSVDDSIIPKSNDWEYFDAIEDVVMVGCPRGIYDEVNNTPIMRRGITATPISNKYNGKPEFMVDLACFPGSSGSPIFIYNRDGYLDRRTNSYMIGASRIHLVGILYSGPIIGNEGEITMSRSLNVMTNTMMHLGYVIRSSEIITLADEVRKTVSSQRTI